MDKSQTGQFGEAAVAKLYKKKGFKILEMNYRTRGGEIDIIAQKSGLVVFSEVKTRQASSKYLAKEAVTKSKQKKLITATLMYISEVGKEPDQMRFDVAEVYIEDDKISKINIIENAFDA